jgi:hypothetical protein
MSEFRVFPGRPLTRRSRNQRGGPHAKAICWRKLCGLCDFARTSARGQFFPEPRSATVRIRMRRVDNSASPASSRQGHSPGGSRKGAKPAKKKRHGCPGPADHERALPDTIPIIRVLLHGGCKIFQMPNRTRKFGFRGWLINPRRISRNGCNQKYSAKRSQNLTT